MDRYFKRFNQIVATVVFAISAFTYISTVEPTVSFWDCGEFIASSFKLEVGHPPGNPVFQIIARVFTLFSDNTHAAMLVNIMSAICSALTILFLYLTIAMLAQKLVLQKQFLKSTALSDCLKICGAAAVGALAYCWSDTFWFSAVEGEVYAMSSLATAIVFWAMLRWEREADEPRANRWIILIMFIMGLSIGVHLLNLLTIPALGLIYYYKKYNGKTSSAGAITAFVVSCVILGVILWIILPFFPRLAGLADRIFVNTLSLPINSGAATFVISVIALCFAGVYLTYMKRAVLLNTILLSIGCILIGYTMFVPIVVRSSVNTPTNEYQPDNPYTLVRYIGREQYGSAPLIYGQTFNSRIYKIDNGTYYNIMEQEDGSLKYEELNKPADAVYADKVFFPRMYTAGNGGSEYIAFYNVYTRGDATDENYIPSFGDNLKYFFGYQFNFMYWRYFMWNFVGRQNDLHSSSPGDTYKGNWESGIGFIDRMHLGDMSNGPAYLLENKAKNHFYFLPLIFGIIGLIYQFKKDRQNFVVIMLLFFMTSVATILYLNQPPYQPRERDYAFAASFYAFAIWIGFALIQISEWLEKVLKNKKTAASLAAVISIIIPIQMVSQTWDDHSRSNRYTCRDMAFNILSGLDENAILVTHGDNDTFPLWYIQEVEGVRTDVRVVNTSLLGIDWYIDQMKFKQYESEPLPITLSKRDYYYGNNDYNLVTDEIKDPILAKWIMNFFKEPRTKVKLADNLLHGRILGKQILIPVDKENVIKHGIVAEKDYDRIADTITLRLSGQSMGKADLILLDILSNYNWDRPIYFLQAGGDVNIGIKEYLQYEGFAYKLVPMKCSNLTTDPNNVELWQMDPQKSYDYLMNTARLESLSYDYYVDYQNLLTFTSLVPIRDIMTNVSVGLLVQGDTTKAVALLDRMQEVMLPKNYPLNVSLIASTNDLAVIEAVATYMACGEKEKALKLGSEFVEECRKHIELGMSGTYGYDIVRRNIYYLLYMVDTYKEGGAVSESAELKAMVDTYVNLYQGS